MHFDQQTHSSYAIAIHWSQSFFSILTCFSVFFHHWRKTEQPGLNSKDLGQDFPSLTQFFRENDHPIRVLWIPINGPYRFDRWIRIDLSTLHKNGSIIVIYRTVFIDNLISKNDKKGGKPLKKDLFYRFGLNSGSIFDIYIDKLSKYIKFRVHFQFKLINYWYILILFIVSTIFCVLFVSR